MMKVILIKVINLLVVVLLLIKHIFKEKEVPLNYSQFHLMDVIDLKNENCYVLVYYNDFETSSMYEFYTRIWNTLIDTRIYKTILHIRMKVIISDRGNCKQIVCHNPIDLTNVCDFDDYWNSVKLISKDLERYYKPWNKDDHPYSRIYIILYY